MGFFFAEPSNHIKHNELKKELKDMRTKGEISGKQHDDMLAHIEQHKRESYSRDHLHKIFRTKKSVSGDSWNSDQIDRVEGRFAKKFEGKVKPAEVKEVKVSKEPSVQEKINIKEYRGLGSESLEAPKPAEPTETQEGSEGRLDKVQ